MKFKFIFLGILVILNLAIFSQNNNNITMGDNFFKELKYLEAIKSYQQAISSQKELVSFYLTQQLAKSYIGLNDYENALIWYKKLMSFEKENTPENIKIYGQLLMNYEDYDVAENIFKLYEKQSKNIKDSEKWIASCQWAKKNKDNNPIARISKTNIEIGTRCMGFSFYEEGLIVAIPQEKRFIEETTYYDLALLKINSDKTFGLPTPLKGDINKPYYEAAPQLFNNGKEIYFTSNSTEIAKYKVNKIKKYELNSNGFNVLKIFHTEQINDEWKNIEGLPFNNNEYSCAFPFITDDGLTLYFCSDMPMGYGGFDLYKVLKKTDGSWGTPLNLGSAINTSENEIYPYVNNTTFYYSSKGGNGFGGYDVFQAEIDGEEIINVKNIGIPINSSKDDFAYTINKDTKSGYFSSNREGSRGYDYIYYFENSIPFDTLNGIVLNKLTGKSVNNASVVINTNISTLTNENGVWKLPIQVNDSVLKITFDSPWYETKTETYVNVREAQEQLNKVFLTPIMLDGKITNISGYENESIKVRLYVKNDNNEFEFIDITEADQNGGWEFHIRKDKEYKVEFFVGDRLSDSEFISRQDEAGEIRAETIEKLRSYELNLENIGSDIDGYLVQIGAYRYPENFKFNKVNSLGKVTHNTQGINDGIVRFSIGFTKNLEAAKILRLKILKLGITDAFIVAIKNNKRAYIVNLQEEILSVKTETTTQLFKKQ